MLPPPEVTLAPLGVSSSASAPTLGVAEAR